MRHALWAGAGVLAATAALGAVGTSASATAHDAAKKTTTTTAPKHKHTKVEGPKKAGSPYLLAQALKGSKQTKTFTTASVWQLGYYYTCSGKKGTFTLYLHQKGGRTVKVTSQHGKSGGGGSKVYPAGQYSLSANTGCKWDVTAIKT